jgi:hypothetical protein
MKSVIMIAYHFPPEGNAGVYRPLRFVRNLPKFGWLPRVISLSAKCYERYDPQLLALVPPETEVIRVANNDPWQSFQHWRARRMQQALAGSTAEKNGTVNASSLRASIREMVRRAEAWIYHPDPEMGWVRPALKATLKLCIDKAPDVIWATAGPVSSFIVAQQASHRTRIPYVLDFRDSWTVTYNEFEDRRPRWAKRLAQYSMYQLLAAAQSVVFRCASEAECYWRAYSGALDPGKVYVLPNGFDGVIEQFTPPQSDRCEILYTGTVSDYRYDTLLHALVVLKKSLPDLASRIHFHFVGEGSDAVANAAAAHGIVDMITTEGLSSYEEVNNRTKRSHALLVLGRPGTMRGYELFAGAKLFGYLKAGMPIIGVLAADETRNVLRRVGVTTIADIDCESEIVSVLSNLVKKWSEGKLGTLLPDRRACENYSAERQIEELDRALKGLPALEGFVPGVAEIPPSLRSEINQRAHQFKPDVTPAARRRPSEL